MTDVAELLRRLNGAGTVERYDLLLAAITEAERRGAERERARIRKDLQFATSQFITELAVQQ